NDRRLWGIEVPLPYLVRIEEPTAPCDRRQIERVISRSFYRGLAGNPIIRITWLEAQGILTFLSKSECRFVVKDYLKAICFPIGARNDHVRNIRIVLYAAPHRQHKS